jgi:hypothetical protein
MNGLKSGSRFALAMMTSSRVSNAVAVQPCRAKPATAPADID